MILTFIGYQYEHTDRVQHHLSLCVFKTIMHIIGHKRADCVYRYACINNSIYLKFETQSYDDAKIIS